ncbi:unnamed protein product [Amoebophrya sp. A120]|nr:unnamed protein product [Amoebophrya sp. A120]|eukprot:GSA120T00014528001.1
MALLLRCCGSSKPALRASEVDRSTIKQTELSAALVAKIEESFKKIDKDGSGEVEIDEAVKVFKRFSGAAAKKMLSDMDENNDGRISKDEWVLYFKRVVGTGDYTEQDVDDEIGEFIDEGMAFSFQVEGLKQTNNAEIAHVK